MAVCCVCGERQGAYPVEPGSCDSRCESCHLSCEGHALQYLDAIRTALSLPPDATAETVLERIREGERAKRAWGAVTAGEWSVRYEFGGWFVYGSAFKAGSRDVSGNMAKDAYTPLAAVLAAMDAQGDK